MTEMWRYPATEKRPEERHVVPEQWSDEQAHVIGPTCWCQPVLDYEDPATGGRVYVHRRTIDGPAYEKSA